MCWIEKQRLCAAIEGKKGTHSEPWVKRLCNSGSSLNHPEASGHQRWFMCVRIDVLVCKVTVTEEKSSK